MAIELPGEVVQLLNFIGINFPQVNEDSVRDFATRVRDFAANVDGTHQAASGTDQQMNAAYSGSSYEALAAQWSQLSSSHMTGPIDACHVVADALDAAADVIVGMKVEAIDELVVPAASFVADQATSSAVLGIGGDASGGGAVGQAFHLMSADLAAHGRTMQGHADQASAHATTLVGNLSAVSFS